MINLLSDTIEIIVHCLDKKRCLFMFYFKERYFLYFYEPFQKAGFMRCIKQNLKNDVNVLNKKKSKRSKLYRFC